jgi:hypothetical protein
MKTRTAGRQMRESAARSVEKAFLICRACVLEGGKLGALAGAAVGMLGAIAFLRIEGRLAPLDWIGSLLFGAGLGIVYVSSLGVILGTFTGVVAGSIAAGAEVLTGQIGAARNARLSGDATELAPAVAPHGRGDEAASTRRT